MIRKLHMRSPLQPADVDALCALPHRLLQLDPSAYLVREGTKPEICSLIVSGFAYRQKLTLSGARQIVSIEIPGDFVDLQNLFLEVSDHNVQSLSRSVVANIPIPALRQLVLDRPAVGKAMWIDALVDASIFREWVVNVGRRDARTRLAHLLCEFSLRLQTAGIGDEQGFGLPMTQEQLADALGLTPVHVNRVLKALEKDGLIRRHRRHVTIQDWAGLREEGDFNERYLHMGQI